MRSVVADLDVERMIANLALDETDRPVRDRKNKLGVFLDHGAGALFHGGRHAPGPIARPAIALVKADLFRAGTHIRAEFPKVCRPVARIGSLQRDWERQAATPLEL